MGKLREALNARMAEGDLGGHLERGVAPTGIDRFDYLNGRFDRKGELSVGVSLGKIVYLAGNSGSGKSSMAIQIGWELVKGHEDGMLYIEDCERSNSHLRVAQLAGIPYEEYAARYEEDKVVHINSGTSTNQLLALLRSIYETKMSVIGGVSFTKKGTSDATDWTKVRKAIADMPPTVVMVDSWAILAPESVDDSGELRGGMDAPRIAKENNALIKQSSNWMYDANITLIIVRRSSSGFSPSLN